MTFFCHPAFDYTQALSIVERELVEGFIISSLKYFMTQVNRLIYSNLLYRWNKKIL